jgi:hypothetical protein
MSKLANAFEAMEHTNGRGLYSARARLCRPVEILLSLLLVVAASLKAHQLFRGEIPVLLGSIQSRFFLTLLLQGELLLAILLGVGAWPRIRSAAAIICFTIFAMASGYEAVRALPSCGCFGNVKTPPLAVASLDVGAVIAICWIRPSLTVSRLKMSSIRRSIGAAATAIAAISPWALYAFANHQDAAGTVTGDLVILEPHAWVGKELTLLSDIKDGQKIAQGQWLVLFYHYDCDSCLKAIPNYAAWARNNKKVNLALIAMPPFAPSPSDPVLITPDYILRLRLKQTHEWFATTPVVAALNNGKVLFAIDGDDAITPPAGIRWPK